MAGFGTLMTLAVFVAVYIGMALGRWPVLRTDRTGIAVLGAAVLLLVAGDRSALLDTVDVGALCVLFGLMVVSAQFDVAGVYSATARRLALSRRSDASLLAVVVSVTGGLSTVLVNDIIVFAMTPVLCRGLMATRRNPVPFLLAHAGAANAGSAATLLGNPQNIIIGEHGGLGFWSYAATAAPVAVLALVAVYLSVLVAWRGRFGMRDAPCGLRDEPGPVAAPMEIDRAGVVKSVAATLALLVLFATPLPRWLSALLVAGAVFVSRRQATRDLMGRVDWHLLALFAGLFVVTGAVVPVLGGPPVQGYFNAGDSYVALAGASLVGSNTIGNVPFVLLVLSLAPDLSETTLRALAILSTLAGNFFIVGSLANVIVAERAASLGVRLGFGAFARSGVPMTLLGMALAVGYLSWVV